MTAARSDSPSADVARVTIIPQGVAVLSEDPRLRLMGQALNWMVRSVTVELVIFSPVDARGAKWQSPVVVSAARAGRRLDPAGLLEDYRGRIHRVDPLAPRQLDGRSVVDLADVLAPDAQVTSVYVVSFLQRHGLTGQTTMLLRARGRTVAVIDLLRGEGDPPPAAAEVALLRSMHGLLETAYAAVSEPRTPATERIAGSALGLTAREEEIAALVAEGASNREIAQALHVSEATVKSHLAASYRKLGVRSRTQLTARLAQAREPG